MNKQDRLDIVTNLVEAGQSREQIKNYLNNEAKWDLAESTLDKYIAEAEKLVGEQPEPETPTYPKQPVNEAAQTSDKQEPYGKSEEAETSKSITSPKRKTDNEVHIAMIEDLLAQGVEHAELLADLENQNINSAEAQEIVTKAAQSLARKEQESHAQEQIEKRKAFDAEVARHLTPARASIENAMTEITAIKKLKQKNGYSTNRFRVAEKILTRLLKTQLKKV